MLRCEQGVPLVAMINTQVGTIRSSMAFTSLVNVQIPPFGSGHLVNLKII